MALPNKSLWSIFQVVDNITSAHLREFTAKILHGSEEHKQWLLDSVEMFIEKGEVLPPRS